jgi:hypothetical protein
MIKDPFNMSQRERYDKKFTSMLQELKDLSVRNNTFTTEEFKKYELLFRKNDIGELDINDPEQMKEYDNRLEEISKITKEFQERIDPYEKITIVDNTGETVLVIAPTFYNPKPLPPESSELVDINVRMSNHDIPKYREEAFINMMNAWNEYQADDKNLEDILEARKEFREYANRFNEIYGKEAVSTEEKTTETQPIYDDDGDWSDEY